VLAVLADLVDGTAMTPVFDHALPRQRQLEQIANDRPRRPSGGYERSCPTARIRSRALSGTETRAWAGR
jgi:hypothetical protein